MQESKLHEINQYEDAAFPVGMYIVTRESIFPKGRGYMDLHWHEELQLTLVTDGRLNMQVNGASYTVGAGEAIFINRNCLHITTELEEAGRYVSFNFPERLLGFFAGSRMEQDDVIPCTGSCGLPAAVFTEKLAWQRRILKELEEMQELFLKEMRGERGAGHFEYRISMLLTGIWYQMICHMEAELKSPSKGIIRKQERIRAMLSFIHENYMNPIRLQDIASFANVSVGECCRCFQEMVRKSPNQYLVAYRISRAMELLGSTEKSVTEIAVETGFNDSSHFIQYFKRQTGATPREYRNQNMGPRGGYIE